MSAETGVSRPARLRSVHDEQSIWRPKTSPEIIRLAIKVYRRFPLSLRTMKDRLHEPGINISHKTLWFGWSLFGAFMAASNQEAPIRPASRNHSVALAPRRGPGRRGKCVPVLRQCPP
jgi:hypothetical protein